MYKKLTSPAKINLYLNIVGKDPRDGYHNLISIVERISLCDYLHVKTNVKKFSIKNKGLKVPCGKTNSVYKTYQLFKNKFNLGEAFEVTLEKHIPLGAGLGGHSSNAATFASFLNDYFKLKLTPRKLAGLLSEISKDAAFFAHDTSFAAVRGKGEIVEPLDIKARLRHLIWIYPGGLSTKKVYTRHGQALTTFLDNANIVANALKRKDPVLLKEGIFNALEKPATEIFPQLNMMKEFLLKSGVEILGMSGSGPTLFCIGKYFPNLPKKKGKWYCLDVKTF